MSGNCKSCLHILTCGFTSTPPKCTAGSIFEIANCKSSLVFGFDMFDDLRRCGGCACFVMFGLVNINKFKSNESMLKLLKLKAYIG